MVSLPTSSSESASSGVERRYRERFREASPPNSNCGESLPSIPQRCGCGILIPVQTLWTPKNPGRRFVQCARRNVRNGRNAGCGMWDWLDGPFTDHSVVVINELLKSKRDLLASRTDMEWSLKMKEAEINALKMRITQGCQCAAGSSMEKKLEGMLLTHEKEKEVMLNNTFRRLNRTFIFTALAMLLAAVGILFRR